MFKHTNTIAPSFKERLSLAKKEISNVRSLTLAAMMVALYVALYASTVNLSETLRINFNWVVLAFAGYLLGPFLAGMVGVSGDIIGFLIRPTGSYFIGFGLNVMMIGVVYGLVLYKTKISFIKILIPRLYQSFIANLIFNSIMLSAMFGIDFRANFIPRLIKNSVLFPIEYIILAATLYFIYKISDQIQSIKGRIIK